ncbi:hypothetical protein [Planctomicrobium piriforme]|uniref:DUF4258 domain-containing protein n=1 Tax=Planctomicrobium piriforme TaxID=1576369 RepID=A0A1I3DFT1_9PLAN|nr:hypothetical protein [Planctomicrobium piriforme]SFH85642.1 hypothetical protein SAMN05421753_103224 [Planctomicrobium piriforme]
MPTRYSILWDLESDPRGNVQHIQQHGITVNDYEHALVNAVDFTSKEQYPGQEIAIGPNLNGRLIAAVYEVISEDQIFRITAYYVGE